jgi:hypothetical protein
MITQQEVTRLIGEIIVIVNQIPFESQVGEGEKEKEKENKSEKERKRERRRKRGESEIE